MQTGQELTTIALVPADAVIGPAGRIHIGGGITCDLSGRVSCTRAALIEIYKMREAQTNSPDASMEYISACKFTIPLEEVAAAYARQTPRGLTTIGKLIRA